jgi:hypothetical protein
MAASLNFEVSFDQVSLAQAARIIAALQAACTDSSASPETPAAAPLQATAPAGKAEDFVEKWLTRLGAGSRKFWRLAAEKAAKLNWLITFEDLEKETGIKAATLRSYHRNSYRAINDEHAPDPMPGSWSGATKRYEYAMSHAVRDRILQLTKNDAT